MFEQVKNTKKFQDYLEQGKELQKTNPLEKLKTIQKWVVKECSYREGLSWLQNSSYCNLGKVEGRIKLGFLVANSIPFGCREATDDECLQIDSYRRSYRVYPFLLKDVPQKLKV